MRKGDELESISLLAPAKINLFLRVLSRRKDGYHEIFTLMVPVSLFDRVAVEKRTEGITIDVGGEFQAPSGKENLCYRAAKLFFERYRIKGGVGIKLLKGIPSGAGLGGGSSDAACVLKSLSLIYMGGVNFEELEVLGRELGADVPFFVRCRPSVARGIGDRLEPVEIENKWWILLVKPPFGVDTGNAYRKLGREEGNSSAPWRVPPVIKEISEIEQMLINDFEEVVFSEHPEAVEVKNRMMELGAEASLMTGSGSALFGIFKSEGNALLAEKEFLEEGYFARLVENL